MSVDFYYCLILHVSQLRSEGRVANVSDVVKRGDHVKVKVLSISGTKLSLSMKVSLDHHVQTFYICCYLCFIMIYYIYHVHIYACYL